MGGYKKECLYVDLLVFEFQVKLEEGFRIFAQCYVKEVHMKRYTIWIRIFIKKCKFREKGR